MRLRLLVSEAWRSLGANLSTTFAAMVTVLVGMFLLGLFIALGTWTVSWSNHVKRELIVKVEYQTRPQATRQQETRGDQQAQLDAERQAREVRLEGSRARSA